MRVLCGEKLSILCGRLRIVYIRHGVVMEALMSPAMRSGSSPETTFTDLASMSVG